MSTMLQRPIMMNSFQILANHAKTFFRGSVPCKVFLILVLAIPTKVVLAEDDSSVSLSRYALPVFYQLWSESAFGVHGIVRYIFGNDDLIACRF